MYCRMIRLHFDDERFDELVAWAEKERPRIESIDGFMTADLVRTGEGQGMIISNYASEEAFAAASSMLAEVMAEMGEFLTGAPHIHAGGVVLSYGR